MMEKWIDVALGILVDWRDVQNSAGLVEKKLYVLITRRPANTVYGGYWELPGGKVEPDEDPAQAMVREMEEELGIQVVPGKALDPVIHTYPHASVRLHPYFCTWKGGEIQNLGVTEHRWVLPGELHSFTFPEANLPILQQMEHFLDQDTLV
jgi:8-oxo-dGTP diphosphatase